MLVFPFPQKTYMAAKNLKEFLAIFLFFCCSLLMAQQDSTSADRFSVFAGFSFSPQFVFLGSLDAGPCISLEYRPFKQNNISFYAGFEARNKWFHLPIQTVGFNGKGLRSFYSINLLMPIGAGYTFVNKKKQSLNSFYAVASPVFFAYNERVTTPYFTNRVSREAAFFIYGLCWSSSKTTKKGRLFNTQFYIPVFSRHPLENLRNMTIKFSWSIYRKK